MKTGIDSANSIYAKKENKLHKIITELQKKVFSRREYARHVQSFHRKLLDENRITKEEMKEFFKPREVKLKY